MEQMTLPPTAIFAAARAGGAYKAVLEKPWRVRRLAVGPVLIWIEEGPHARNKFPRRDDAGIP